MRCYGIWSLSLSVFCPRSVCKCHPTPTTTTTTRRPHHDATRPHHDHITTRHDTHHHTTTPPHHDHHHQEAKKLQDVRLEKQEVGEWVAAVDARTGQTHFFNTRTNATTWRLPAGGSSSSSLPRRKRKEKKRRDETHVIFARRVSSGSCLICW